MVWFICQRHSPPLPCAGAQASLRPPQRLHARVICVWPYASDQAPDTRPRALPPATPSHTLFPFHLCMHTAQRFSSPCRSLFPRQLFHICAIGRGGPIHVLQDLLVLHRMQEPLAPAACVFPASLQTLCMHARHACCFPARPVWQTPILAPRPLAERVNARHRKGSVATSVRPSSPHRYDCVFTIDRCPRSVPVPTPTPARAAPVPRPHASTATPHTHAHAPRTHQSQGLVLVARPACLHNLPGSCLPTTPAG